MLYYKPSILLFVVYIVCCVTYIVYCVTYIVYCVPFRICNCRPVRMVVCCAALLRLVRLKSKILCYD